MNAWIAVVLAGLGCFSMRFGVVAFVERRPLPGWFDRATVFVVPASLAGLCALALVVPMVAGGTGTAFALATLTTAVVASRRSSAIALLSGMLVIWVAAAAGVGG